MINPQLPDNHAAGVSRRQAQNVTKCSKQITILNFGVYIWILKSSWEMHSYKYKHAYSIGSLICEMAVKMSEMYWKQT